MREAFKVLRVLDAKPIKVNKIHSGLCLLVHLRYVTLSLDGDVLPKAISKLRNVQTLIVDTTSRTLKIEADILKMVELRHFETNASATLPKRSKAFEQNKRLQTLCGVSPKSCTKEFFRKLPNLKKLGIYGQLALLLLEGKNELLTELVKVEKLKLVNQVTGPKDEGKNGLFGVAKKMRLRMHNWGTSPKDSKLSRLLLEASRFPPNLRSLTLSATCLDWEHISILGSMENLKVLKLKDNEFVGDKWKVMDDGFPHLETLHIVRAYFLHWEALSNPFQKLRSLLLSECMKLKEIPFELADIPTFQELHLRNCNYAAESAKNIERKKIEKWRTDRNTVFKLLRKDISE